MKRSLLVLCLAAAIALPWQAGILGQAAEKKPDNQLPERFRAFVTNLGDVRTTADNRMVEMQISRWTTEEEEQKLFEALKEKGPRAMLSVMQGLPATGWIRSQGGLSYDLRYARQAAGKEGGRQITLMTDRQMNFWELQSATVSRDYPYTVVRLATNKEGKWEGSMTIATKIELQAGILVFEDLSTRPVQLMSITHEKKNEKNNEKK
ncbi:MAG: hypothetical protein KBA95_16845 [Acidobacteria bacterium]|nr:hypothetical protein [Acidobacteriota bacterium]